MSSNRLINLFRFNKIFWWAICIFVALNLVFFIVIGGHQRDRMNTLQNLYQAKRKITLPKKKDDNQQRLIQAKEDIQHFKKELPPRTQFAGDAAELYETLHRHPLSVGNIVYKPEGAGAQNLVKYSTSFTVKGKYNDLKAFLGDIQESKTLFSIESLSFTNRSKDEQSVDMIIKIATYLR